MLFNSTFKSVLHADTTIKSNQLDAPLPSPYTLEPMTLRFVSVDGNGIVTSQQLVGKSAGKLTQSTYKGEDMWVGVSAIIPYLEELTAYAGEVLHFACICHPEGNTMKRYPILLVETTDFKTDVAAANFSRGNLRNASVEVGMGEYQLSQEKYVAFIKQRNDAWLKRNSVTFAEPRSKQDIISDMEKLIAELKQFS